MTDNGHGPVPVQGHHQVLNIPPFFSIFKDVFLDLTKMYFLRDKELLPCNYQKTIDDFRSAWFNLTEMFGDSTTSKLHILIDHLEDYFELTDATHIKTSDELCEKMHQHPKAHVWLLYSQGCHQSLLWSDNSEL